MEPTNMFAELKDEIPFPVEKTNVSEDQFVSNLKTRRKMKRLGCGAHASVFGSRTGRTVVKVGSIDDNNGNIPYLEFIKKSMRYKNNPYFPKIKSVKVYEYLYRPTRNKPHAKYYMVVELERLIEAGYKYDTAANFIEDAVGDEAFVENLGVLIGKKNAKHFSQAINLLQDLCRGAKYFELDIHTGNIMFRKNGQIVITDPLA